MVIAVGLTLFLLSWLGNGLWMIAEGSRKMPSLSFLLLLLQTIYLLTSCLFRIYCLDFFSFFLVNLSCLTVSSKLFLKILRWLLKVKWHYFRFIPIKTHISCIIKTIKVKRLLGLLPGLLRGEVKQKVQAREIWLENGNKKDRWREGVNVKFWRFIHMLSEVSKGFSSLG